MIGAQFTGHGPLVARVGGPRELGGPGIAEEVQVDGVDGKHRLGLVAAHQRQRRFGDLPGLGQDECVAPSHKQADQVHRTAAEGHVHPGAAQGLYPRRFVGRPAGTCGHQVDRRPIGQERRHPNQPPLTGRTVGAGDDPTDHENPPWSTRPPSPHGADGTPPTRRARQEPGSTLA